MSTVRAEYFSANRGDDGFAYFTVQFNLDGVKHQRREIYSGFIAPGATFIHPEIADESNNWAARGELLEAYRALNKELTK